jgi:hypothetical protein
MSWSSARARWPLADARPRGGRGSQSERDRRRYPVPTPIVVLARPPTRRDGLHQRGGTSGVRTNARVLAARRRAWGVRTTTADAPLTVRGRIRSASGAPRWTSSTQDARVRCPKRVGNDGSIVGGDRRGRHRVVAERPPMRHTRRATDSARHRAACRVYQACVFRAPRRRWDPVSKRHRMRRARRGVGCLGLAVAAPFANQITSRVTCAQKLSLELILLLTSLKPQRCRSRSSTAHELQDAHRCAVRVLNRNAARFLSTRAVRALTRISEGAQTPMLCNEYDE